MTIIAKAFATSTAPDPLFTIKLPDGTNTDLITDMNHGIWWSYTTVPAQPTVEHNVVPDRVWDAMYGTTSARTTSD